MMNEINGQQIIIYQTEDGQTKIDVQLEGNTVWLSQRKIAELFQKDVRTINEHIKNILQESELNESTIRKIRTVQNEGNRNVERLVEHYNLEMILAVGYRVKSLRGTQFRKWATSILHEYTKKGFVLNDDLLKQSGGGGYWKELLARIRDIRTSEKVFYRQVLEIYATSVDYSPNAEENLKFFKIIQNKMHFAAHGHTAAEIEYLRADSSKPFMGLTSFTGARPKKSDVTIAKNYLTEKELDYLNRITTLCLDFAEFQAKRQKPLYMKDWINKIDEFLKVNDCEILNDSGKISKKEADNKALSEYGKYKKLTVDELSEVERHFLDCIKDTQKKLEQS